MIDILAIGAHPDDVELCAGGTLIAHKKRGLATGVIDLTHGEMSTRGTPGLRDQEASKAAEILGLDIRENLNFKDVFFKNDDEHKLKIVQAIRKYPPHIILANAVEDRHPDHGKAAIMVEEACFWSGLRKINTTDDNGHAQEPHRPNQVYHYIQSRSLQPDFYVDISAYEEQKKAAYMAYKSQLHDPESTEPETLISSPEFLAMLEARDREYGMRIGRKFAEGFMTRSFIGISRLDDLTV